MARTLLRAILSAVILSFGLSSALWSPAIAATATPLEQPLSQPNWSELNPQQKKILAPLAKDWDGLESFRRKKWLGIANRYPAMTPEQQQRVQVQMKPWSNLTPEERNEARERFKKEHMESQEQREAKRKKWEEYKALPESEKRKFREKAAKKAETKRAKGKFASRPLTHPKSLAPVTQVPATPTLSGTTAGK